MSVMPRSWRAFRGLSVSVRAVEREINGRRGNPGEESQEEERKDIGWTGGWTRGGGNGGLEFFLFSQD